MLARGVLHSFNNACIFFCTNRNFNSVLFQNYKRNYICWFFYLVLINCKSYLFDYLIDFMTNDKSLTERWRQHLCAMPFHQQTVKWVLKLPTFLLGLHHTLPLLPTRDILRIKHLWSRRGHHCCYNLLD